jgi:hypothetical protein
LPERSASARLAKLEKSDRFLQLIIFYTMIHDAAIAKLAKKFAWGRAKHYPQTLLFLKIKYY